MTRSYDAQDVIALPRLKAPGTHALGVALLSAAEPYELPKSLARTLGRLRGSVLSLGEALALVTPRGGYPPETVAADVVVDACAGALRSWLQGWAKLPGVSQAAQAQGVLDDIFKDGLDFTQIAYPDEWGEVGARLKTLHDKGHEETIEALGGKLFLVRLRAAHKTYGDLLGITEAKEAAAPKVRRREAYEATLGALREYVLKVAAHADEEDEASQELVRQLLRPLVELRARTARAAVDAEADTEAPTPV